MLPQAATLNRLLSVVSNEDAALLAIADVGAAAGGRCAVSAARVRTGRKQAA